MHPVWILNMVLTSNWWRLIGGECVCVCALAIKTSDFLSMDSEHSPPKAINAFHVPTNIWCDKNISSLDKLRYFHAVVTPVACCCAGHGVIPTHNKIQEAHDHIHISMKTFVCTFAAAYVVHMHHIYVLHMMCSRLKISFYVNKVLRMYNLYPYDVTYTKSDLTDMWANVKKKCGGISDTKKM